MSTRITFSKQVEVEEITPNKQSTLVKVGPKTNLGAIRVLWEDDEVVVVRLVNGNKLNNIPKDAVDSIVW